MGESIVTRRGSAYSLTQRARRLFYNEMWNIAVVDQAAEDIARCGIRVAPRWLPALPPGQMLADPAFRQRPDGGCTLYAEHLDYRHGIGEIWSAEVGPDEDLTKARFQALLAPQHHVSYPFPFEDETGRMLLTAETWQAGDALLWQEANGLRPLRALMSGRQVVDPTLWRGLDYWWLFCTFHDIEPDEALFLFYTPRLDAPWVAHPANPVKTGRAGSRPAGPLFRAGDKLIRPGQDCSKTYGGAIILHTVTCLDKERFEEVPLRRLEPWPGDFDGGLHTLCPAGRVTLIDGKNWCLDLRKAGRKVLGRRS